MGSTSSCYGPATSTLRRTMARKPSNSLPERLPDPDPASGTTQEAVLDAQVQAALGEAIHQVNRIVSKVGLGYEQRMTLADELRYSMVTSAHLDLLSGRKPTSQGPAEGQRPVPRLVNDDVQSAELRGKLVNLINASPDHQLVTLAEIIDIFFHGPLPPPSPPKPHDPVSLPERAPVLWTDRKTRFGEARVTPVQFIEAIYGPWLGKGLTRKRLHDLDTPLYHALSVWEKRHPNDRMTLLPTFREVINQQIEMLADKLSPDDLRKLGSALQSRRQRDKKDCTN